MDETPIDGATGKPIPEWPMRQTIMEIMKQVKSGQKTMALAREEVIFLARTREPDPNTAHEFDDNTLTENKYGEWVPAIEEPYFFMFRKGCRCGRRFWTYEGYQAHAALEHILGL